MLLSGAVKWMIKEKEMAPIHFSCLLWSLVWELLLMPSNHKHLMPKLLQTCPLADDIFLSEGRGDLQMN